MAKAGVPSDSLSMRSYDDEITYRLLPEVLIDVDTVPHAFGQHWVNHTLARLRRACGSTMLEFLGNLNAFDRTVSLPDYQPPEFRVSGSTAEWMWSTLAIAKGLIVRCRLTGCIE